MKKIIAFLGLSLVLVTGLFAQVSAENVEKAYTILEATDDVLAYHGDYSATVSFQIEKPGKPKESVQYKIFERTDKKLMTLVQLFPEADKGNGFLRDGDNIWAYDPISRKFTHTSIKESIGNSDVKLDDIEQDENSWRINYDITGFEEGKLGKYDVWIITITAKTNEPSYAKTKYYVQKDVNLVESTKIIQVQTVLCVQRFFQVINSLLQVLFRCRLLYVMNLTLAKTQHRLLIN